MVATAPDRTMLCEELFALLAGTLGLLGHQVHELRMAQPLWSAGLLLVPPYCPASGSSGIDNWVGGRKEGLGIEAQEIPPPILLSGKPLMPQVAF